MIGKAHYVDMEDALSYSLHPFPHSSTTNEETLAKTDKSRLRKCIERLPSKDCQLASPPTSELIWIEDGMALFQEMKDIPVTFGKLADQILDKLLSVASKDGARRVDFVPDRYPDVSIKGGERIKRAKLRTQLIIITGRKFRKFLSCGANKEDLVEFLLTHWQSCRPESLGELKLMVGHRNQCHRLQVVDGRTKVELIEELCNDHEEADTRVFLHASHAASKHNKPVLS